MICEDCEFKEFHKENYSQKGFCPFDIKFPNSTKKVDSCTKMSQKRILATIGVF